MASLEKLEKSYGVTTPRQPAGTETRKAQQLKRSEPGKNAEKFSKISARVPFPNSPSCASRAARDLAHFGGNGAV